MTEVTAQLKYLRIAPRKVRLVADCIRSKTVQRAAEELSFLQKRSAAPILKLLRSAVANAKNNFRLPEEGLYVKKIVVNEGPRLKRFRPRAFGRASQILKRTSHISLTLGVKETQPTKS